MRKNVTIADVDCGTLAVHIFFAKSDNKEELEAAYSELARTCGSAFRADEWTVADVLDIIEDKEYDVKVRRALAVLTPSIEEVIEEIRAFRNNVAHLRDIR
ncbi:MAG: hypothetical protein Q4C49_00030 [Bacillota bacterium]|nr:hypothetical protein [Bacillota bacterium]